MDFNANSIIGNIKRRGALQKIILRSKKSNLLVLLQVISVIRKQLVPSNHLPDIKILHTQAELVQHELLSF